MTPGERFASALAASLALHWAVLGFTWDEAPPRFADDAPVVSLTGAETGISLEAPITLEQAAPAEPAAENPADRRRAAMIEYLDALAEAVHARRALGGGALLGNAAVAVTIDAAGRFSGVRLAGASGDSRLDADALAAVRAASGAVPRPRVLGPEPLGIVLVVKYQLGL